MRQLMCLVAVVCLASSARADESTQQVCEKFKSVKVPAADQPSSAERQGFSASQRACEDHLYGFGVKEDPVQARKCCLARGDCLAELAMIYANGWGVKRNYDLAAHFACKSEAAPAEVEGMVEHLQTMRTAASPKPLVYCEHVTSGMGMGYCESLEEKRQVQQSEAKLAELRKTWDANTQKGFAALKKAADRFFDAEASLQSDHSRSGSMQSSQFISARSELNKKFTDALVKASAQPTLSAGEAELKKTDAELNSVYKAKMAEGDQTSKDLMRAAQRAWIPYRDAWVKFYQARWGKAVDGKKLSTQVLTQQTRERVEALKAFEPTNLD